MATDGYLRSVPSDANPNDGRLYDPTVGDPVAYSLACDAASFALSGVDTNVLRGARVACSTTDFSLTGIAAGATRALRLPASAASFAFTGNAANVLRSYVVAAARATFVETGISSNVLESHVLAAAAGALALQGSDAGLRAERLIAGAPGLFTFAGVDAGLSKESAGGAYTLVAAAGAFTFVGYNVELSVDLSIAIVYSSFSFPLAVSRPPRPPRAKPKRKKKDKETAALLAYSMRADPGVIAVARGDAGLRYDRRLAADAGAVDLSAANADFTVSPSEDEELLAFLALAAD